MGYSSSEEDFEEVDFLQDNIDNIQVPQLQKLLAGDPFDLFAMSAESSTGATAPVRREFKPPAPKFGGLIMTKADFYTAWTGGKPNADGTGLDPAASTNMEYPGQLRPVDESKTNYEARTEGLKIKFKRGHSLVKFCQTFMK